MKPTIWDGEEIGQVLDLQPLGGDRFANRYAHLNSNSAMFGGQLLGMALAAASRTVDDRLPHAMHAHFLTQVSTSEAVDIAVDRVRDGRSFSTRNVRVEQGRGPAFECQVSFQTEATGFFHEASLPPDVGGPEDHPPAAVGLAAYAERLERHPVAKFTTMRGVEIRPVDFPAYAFGGNAVEQRRIWTRIPGASSIADPVQHLALLAYLSDYWLAGTVALAHAEDMRRMRVFMATLNHSIWFHAPVRTDEWLLLASDTPSASGGRGLVRGTFHDRSGRLVASVAQEVLLRHL